MFEQGNRHPVAGALAAFGLLALAGCAPAGEPPPATQPPAVESPAAPSPTAESPAGESPTAAAATELRLMTHDSFAISDDVLAEFEQQHGLQVRVLRAGDAGSMVNQAILARDAPLADVLFGVDNTFLSRAVEADIFLAHRSPLLEQVPAELHPAVDGAVTPIDYGDVCLNFDRSAFDAELQPPQRLEDLLEPAYHGMLVVENPATSSPGLAFLLATVAHFGDEGETTWRDFWAGLRENDVLVTSGWEEAYYGQFSGGSGEGSRPIVVSYASSPAAEVVFADPQPAEAPTGVMEEGCFRQIEYAGVLRGTRAEPAARAFIDFMLSERFQADIPLNMFVFPANSAAQLPEVFVEHAAAIDRPVTLDPSEIGSARERWIEEWTDVVLR